jgi:hypothetical protein
MIEYEGHETLHACLGHLDHNNHTFYVGARPNYMHNLTQNWVIFIFLIIKMIFNPQALKSSAKLLGLGYWAVVRIYKVLDLQSGL